MGGRGILIASVLLAILAGGVYWSEQRKKAEEGKPAADAPPKLITTAADQMTRIEIRKREAPPVTIERGKDKNWAITSPSALSADQDAVSSITGALSGLTWDRLVEEKAANLGDFGLLQPQVEVIFNSRDGKTQTLLIGDENPSGSAFFAKLAGDPRVFTIYSSTKTTFDKTARDLRDKRLLTFDSDKLTRVEVTAKGQTVEFGKNNQNEWQIVRPRPLRADGFQVEELVRKLKDVRMDTSVSEEDVKKASSLFANGTVAGTARVTDASGTQTLEIRKNKDDYYARSNAVEGIHKVTQEIGEALAKGLDDYRNRKLFDFGFDEPSRIEVRDGDKTYSLEKSGSEWKMNGKKVDAANVQQLIDKLRDLSAIKFADGGFTTSVMDLAVTSKEGKRIEKVLISKTGDTYLAKRENEPSVYVLDGAIIDGIRKSAAEMK